jgi:hypothetical protein
VSTDAGARVARVVRTVCAAAVRDAAASGVIVLDDWTPEGELVYEWLVQELDEARVWRAASLLGNVAAGAAEREQHAVAWRAARDESALVAHPANRTALLLGGRLPAADLLPLGDLWASRVELLVGRWTAGPEVEALAAAAGGIRALDRALELLLAGGPDPAAQLPGLDAETAQLLVEMYERGRYFRLRPRVVAKLESRTVGIDLFD